MSLKIKIIGIAVALSIPLSALAISFSSQTYMSLTISPETPVPGGNFKAELKSYVFDTLRANTQWYLNGKVVASGRGITEQTFVAGKIGSVMNIRVEAIALDGATYETSASIPISDVDLIVSADTYAPVGYRGASLPTPGSILEVYAIPYLFSGGSRLSAKNLIYEWAINGEGVAGSSGGGKTKFEVALPNFSSARYDISLKVSSLSGSISTTKNLTILAQSPETLFYKTDSLVGRSRVALSDFMIPAGGVFSIIAEPYFMSMSSLAKSVVIWKANGQNITQPSETPRILEVAAPQDSYGGSTNFSFVIEDVKKIFQRAVGSLTITAQ